MYRISNSDRNALLELLRITQGLEPVTLLEQNRLRNARLALKRLARKRQEQR